MTVAQARIHLVQGVRVIKDKVTFVVAIEHAKDEDPRNATRSNEVQIFTGFARQATGMVYLDNNALGRFDESPSFSSNPADITYGRHTLTLVFASPAVVTDFYVTIRGSAVPREILSGEGSVALAPNSMEQRIVELERKVSDLEAEIVTLKKKRGE